MTRVSLTAVLSLLLTACPFVQRSRERLEGVEIIEGHRAVAHRALVKFPGEPGELPPKTWNPAAETGIDDLSEYARFPEINVIVLRSPSLSAANLVAELRALSRFKYVEPDFLYAQTRKPPEDPYFTSGKLWGLLNIDAPTAWLCSVGGPNIVVAVVDGGITVKNNDFDGNIWKAPANFKVNVGGKDIPCAKGSPGYDTLRKNCKSPESEHGSHVAATIAGAEGKDGVVGVTWVSKLMSVRFLQDGEGELTDAVTALSFVYQARKKYPAQANVRVVNMSWGGRARSDALYDILKLMSDDGILLVAGAGNDSTNNDATPFYPASYDIDNLISVAASDDTDTLAALSNYGKTSVDIAAPGIDIWSVVDRNAWGRNSGTSMSAAHVSGAAALVAAACPSASAPMIRKRLVDKVDPVKPFQGREIAGGRLDVAQAVKDCTCPDRSD